MHRPQPMPTPKVQPLHFFTPNYDLSITRRLLIKFIILYMDFIYIVRTIISSSRLIEKRSSSRDIDV
jgi:hypothetical protein